MNKPLFTWDPEAGVATCTLTDKDKTFIGTAICAPDDIDMMSEKTGCQIAQWRAELNFYIHIRDNELKPQIQVLNHLLSTVSQRYDFNSKSHDAKMMYSLYRQKENDLAVIKDMIAMRKQMLKEYIEEKDKFYQKIRTRRAKAKNN